MHKYTQTLPVFGLYEATRVPQDLDCSTWETSKTNLSTMLHHVSELTTKVMSTLKSRRDNRTDSFEAQCFKTIASKSITK